MQRMWRRGPDGEIIRSEAEEQEPSSVGTETDTLSPEGTSQTPLSRARARLALRLGFRDTYDYLGTVLVMSMLSALIPAAGGWAGHSLGGLLFAVLPERLNGLLSLILALVGAALLWGPTAAGLYRFARNAAARSEPEIFDLAWGFRAALRRSMAVGLVQTLVAVLLAGNGYFYLIQRHPAFAILGAVCLYALLFWLLMGLYQWPLLIEQDLRPGAVIRKSALLVLDNMRFSLLVGLALGLMAILLWSLVVPGVLLWGGAAAIFHTQATRELLRRYRVLPPDPTLDPIADETHELGGRGWHE